MSKSRKKSKNCSELPITDPGFANRIDSPCSQPDSNGKCFFPTNIKKLLILIAEDEDNDNTVDIVLDACSNHCFIEDAQVIAVMDNTVIIRDCDSFRFVCIDCICEVIVDCDTILDELFEEHSYNQE